MESPLPVPRDHSWGRRAAASSPSAIRRDAEHFLASEQVAAASPFSPASLRRRPSTREGTPSREGPSTPLRRPSSVRSGDGGSLPRRLPAISPEHSEPFAGLERRIESRCSDPGARRAASSSGRNRPTRKACQEDPDGPSSAPCSRGDAGFGLCGPRKSRGSALGGRGEHKRKGSRDTGPPPPVLDPSSPSAVCPRRPPHAPGAALQQAAAPSPSRSGTPHERGPGSPHDLPGQLQSGGPTSPPRPPGRPAGGSASPTKPRGLPRAPAQAPATPPRGASRGAGYPEDRQARHGSKGRRTIDCARTSPSSGGARGRPPSTGDRAAGAEGAQEEHAVAAAARAGGSKSSTASTGAPRAPSAASAASLASLASVELAAAAASAGGSACAPLSSPEGPGAGQPRPLSARARGSAADRPAPAQEPASAAAWGPPVVDQWDSDSSLSLQPPGVVGPGHSQVSCVRGPNGLTSLSVAAFAAGGSSHTFRADTFQGLSGTQLDAAGAVKGSCISWVPGEEVGQGTLGTVFKALDQRSGQIFAVKEVRIDPHLTEEQRFKSELQNEINMLRDLKHPNIVSYLGHDEINSRLYIYLEYMPGGSVAHVLSQFGAFDESLIASRGRGLLAGLEYLHTCEPVVLHRDIKGANILLGVDGLIKLADFGCSKRTQDTMARTCKGSVPWMAPEVIMQSGIGRRSDIWSFGCVIIEMATARAPWGPFDNQVAAMRKIAMTEETPGFPDSLSEGCQDFIVQCTQRDKSKRPLASALLQHRFMRGAAEADG
ncbi:unnamed protein product [Prorocentrum cordatum]|uniref:Protein kinase domain-containing protein n=1 Tax=Prorocentrum cordatum TaxID=2364126 RepID=A0ABN9S0I0_9DINO|nr:unnamed protein product [Polarella glacialis]